MWRDVTVVNSSVKAVICCHSFRRIMEEVDNIIIHSLRQIGCNVDESVTHLGNFTTELVVEATIRCLDTIRPAVGLSTVLPVNMAARFRLGATLAQMCAELGYRGEIGYQTFLYSSEADLRKVFTFLIEKLPKESDKTLNEPTSDIALLEKSIASSISLGLSIPWLPYYCHKKGFRNRGRASIPYQSVCVQVPESNRTEGYLDYCAHYQQPVPDQMQNQLCFLPSILSHNARGLHSCSLSIEESINWLNNQQQDKITLADKYTKRGTLRRSTTTDGAGTCADDVPAEERPKEVRSPKREAPDEDEKQEVESEKIKAQCEDLRINIEDLQEELKQLSSKLSQATTNYQNDVKELEAEEGRIRIKARTCDLLEDSEENVKKLEAAIEASTNKLVNLASQWEKHRVPLIQKYREEREKHSSKASASQRKLDEIKLLKAKEKELLDECRNKDQQYSQLMSEVQKLPKEVNRSAYTQRILEIINNVRKQRDEINKVLADTREIQKEINTLTGRLERSFTVVDELIFRDARNNEASRKAYKLLATLHSDCSELVSLVEETGATVREIRDLEEQVDSESAKNVGANLERITADLKQMKQETAALTAQLQSKSS